MAVTISSLALAAALRAGDGTTALTEPLSGVIVRLLGAATALVEGYAPNAPESVQDEAVVRLAGWMYDAIPGRTWASAMGQSGAQSILSPWRSRRARNIEDAGLALAIPLTPATATATGMVMAGPAYLSKK